MTTPDTIVLIHGFWVTPRSWEHWKSRYEAKGFTVHTPAYPGFEVEVEALRRATRLPSPTSPSRRSWDTSRRSSTASTPSRSSWGTRPADAFTQVVMDHGYGCCGVVLNSAPTEGVRVTPWTQLHSVFPVLKNPLNHHRAVGFDLEQWTYAFTNTYTPEESQAFYERYHIPASGRVLFDSVLANFKPGHQEAWVDFGNPRRVRPCCSSRAARTHHAAIGSGIERQRATRAPARSPSTSTFDGRPAPHGRPARAREEIADRALEWALANAAWTPSTER